MLFHSFPDFVLYHREMWPATPIFLCLWHVRRAWQKHSCYKIKDIAQRAEILQELGSMMYDKTSPGDSKSATWASEKLQELSKKYPKHKDFWDYMIKQWQDKAHMWVVGYRNLPYAGQDTNAAIEGYHGFLKSILKSERSRMVGRRVDWTITALTEEVHDHFWYKGLRKETGFIDNKKMQDYAVTALIKARDIPDCDVTLNVMPGNYALVTSSKHPHIRYAVYNPGEEWAGCNCVWAQRGNICKHLVKVLLMLRPDIAEDRIARFCGRQAGTIVGGMKQLLAPSTPQHHPPFSANTTPILTPKRTPLRNSVPAKDLSNSLRQLVIDLSEEVMGDVVLIEHVLADLNQVIGRIRALKAEMKSGLVHPLVASPVLCTVNDGRGFSLIRDKDFLERRGNTEARRLRMFGC